MFEAAVQLLVFRITVIIHPLRRHSGCSERRFIEIGSSRGAAEIAIGAGGADDSEQTFRLDALYRIGGVARDLCLQSERLANAAQEDGVDVREQACLFWW